ncbi:hypothetical protein IF2G_10366 [Cordyceps javanica]|nr:hypothetical protein IF2G_10366 [Cordyceps javanica]
MTTTTGFGMGRGERGQLRKTRRELQIGSLKRGPRWARRSVAGEVCTFKRLAHREPSEAY